ncbi:hypothetical protein H6758_04860 [Candidatus Nomurabacteria bacterium]|nr:hypothetical protein [Candidatus Nomurabacteria bacterium]
MPKYITPDTQIGDVFHIWDVQEYETHTRGKWWYIITIGIAAVFLVYAYFQSNPMFALVVVLSLVIVYLQANQTPPVHQFAIAESGIVIGNKIYSYNEFEEFYIVYQPPRVQSLFIETKDFVRPTIRVPLESAMDPLDLRHTLRTYLPENIEKEDEPWTDTWVRRMKIH